MEKLDCIIALASPNGAGALGIIRVSGKDSFTIVESCIKEKEKFNKAQANVIKRYTIIEGYKDQFIDEITAIKYLHPKSYTGENMVEIICHGSKMTISNILQLLQKNGANIAKKGEFTRTAFLNGKLDLIKAENIKSLIDCNNILQKRINENVHNRKYETILNNWREALKEIIINIETDIEFNEDVSIDTDSQINKVLEIKYQIEKEIGVWEKIEKYQDGITIVIAGPPNAGKSSLFNKIIGYDRTIVTDIPGTTRDIVSEKINIKGNEITLIDSAGIRNTENKIEIIGIEKTKNVMEKAHIVLWVVGIDQKYQNPEIEYERIIKVINKIDIKNTEYKYDQKDMIGISVERDENLDRLMIEIEEKIQEISDSEIPEIIGNKRHLQIAKNIKENINEVVQYWNEKEKAAYYINKIFEEIEEFFGRRDREEIYNSIFETYCIGK